MIPLFDDIIVQEWFGIGQRPTNDLDARMMQTATDSPSDGIIATMT
jgi:hypothetical protein